MVFLVGKRICIFFRRLNFPFAVPAFQTESKESLFPEFRPNGLWTSYDDHTITFIGKNAILCVPEIFKHFFQQVNVMMSHARRSYVLSV